MRLMVPTLFWVCYQPAEGTILLRVWGCRKSRWPRPRRCCGGTRDTSTSFERVLRTGRFAFIWVEVDWGLMRKRRGLRAGYFAACPAALATSRLRWQLIA